MAVAAATRLKLITSCSTGKIKNRCSCMVWRNNTKWKRVDTRCTRLQCATSNWLSESRNACALLWENGLTRLAWWKEGIVCGCYMKGCWEHWYYLSPEWLLFQEIVLSWKCTAACFTSCFVLRTTCIYDIDDAALHCTALDAPTQWHQ